MDNKILVKIYSPELGESYDVFIPVNEYISVVSKLVASVISNITGVETFVNKMAKEVSFNSISWEHNKGVVKNEILEDDDE